MASYCFSGQLFLCYKHVDYFILLRIHMFCDHMIRQLPREHAGYGISSCFLLSLSEIYRSISGWIITAVFKIIIGILSTQAPADSGLQTVTKVSRWHLGSSCNLELGLRTILTDHQSHRAKLVLWVRILMHDSNCPRYLASLQTNWPLRIAISPLLGSQLVMGQFGPCSHTG